VINLYHQSYDKLWFAVKLSQKQEYCRYLQQKSLSASRKMRTIIQIVFVTTLHQLVWEVLHYINKSQATMIITEAGNS